MMLTRPAGLPDGTKELHILIQKEPSLLLVSVNDGIETAVRLEWETGGFINLLLPATKVTILEPPAIREAEPTAYFADIRVIGIPPERGIG